MTKAHPTPKRRDALRRMREHGDELRAWIFREREKPEVDDEETGGGHGVTVYMRNVRPRPPEWIKRHPAPSRWDRRHVRTETGAIQNRPVMLHGSNEPHVIPEAERTRDRRLRGKARRRARRSA